MNLSEAEREELLSRQFPRRDVLGLTVLCFSKWL